MGPFILETGIFGLVGDYFLSLCCQFPLPFFPVSLFGNPVRKMLKIMIGYSKLLLLSLFSNTLFLPFLTLEEISLNLSSHPPRGH